MYLILFTAAFAIHGTSCQEDFWSEWQEWSACIESNGSEVMSRKRLSISKLYPSNSIEVKDCYGDKICKESVFINQTIQLSQLSVLATLKNFYKDFVLSFEVYTPKSKKELNGNIVQLLDSDYNECCPLAHYFSGRLKIYSGTGSQFFVSKQRVEVNNWHSVQVQQTSINDKYNNIITINGKVVTSTVNYEPQDLFNITMYACLDPCPAGAIRNINISSETKGIWYHWSGWTTCDKSGKTKRSRLCDNSCGKCVGNNTETISCPK
ncbi:uncharacterized protein LOC105844646 [Hydra vulgaris]|uniref:uncharacterized protein LOC105844646 n=1 Tax=Hydra vulgaris TaxID=6087 RepID=UPI001F5F7B55|nr:uncharacterized protein LOC105844646 [Hydra vulgaris]